MKMNDQQYNENCFDGDDVDGDDPRKREVKNAELLSLVSVNSDQGSDDNMESVQKFERNCHIFGVSSEDFD